MSKRENDIRINKYLDGEMSREEEIAFEQELNSNTELQEDLNLHLEIDKVIQYRELDQDYASFLKKFRKRYQRPNDKPFLSKGNLIVVTIILIIAGIVTIFAFIPSKPDNGNELFSQYYKPYALSNNYRSAGDLEMDRGLRAYDSDNFDEALIFFENMLEIEPFNSKAHFAAGISALELNENKRAAAHFTEILESDNLEFYQQAQWYLALTYLRMNKIQEAEILLIALRNTGGYYHKQASEIVDKLR